jgi:outer membrane protein assembly factor BamA
MSLTMVGARALALVGAIGMMMAGACGAAFAQSRKPSTTIVIVEFAGTRQISVRAIEERLQKERIALRLNATPDNLVICSVKEVVAEMMADKGFPAAEVTHDIAPLPRDPSSLRLVFTIIEGVRSAAPTVKPKRSPAERCLER